MRVLLKFFLVIFSIVVILYIGASIFDEPSWGGFVFYLIFLAGLLGAAGYWLLNLK